MTTHPYKESIELLKVMGAEQMHAYTVFRESGHHLNSQAAYDRACAFNCAAQYLREGSPGGLAGAAAQTDSSPVKLLHWAALKLAEVYPRLRSGNLNEEADAVFELSWKLTQSVQCILDKHLPPPPNPEARPACAHTAVKRHNDGVSVRGAIVLRQNPNGGWFVDQAATDKLLTAAREALTPEIKP